MSAITPPSGGDAVSGSLEITPLVIVAMVTYGVVALVYLWWFVRGLRIDRKGHTLSRMINTAPGWVGKFVRMPGREVDAVQTLRNVILATSFIATLAFTTATSVVSSIPAQQDSGLNIEEVRKLFLASLLYLAFLNFAVSLRSATHVSFLLSAATGQLSERAVRSSHVAATAAPVSSGLEGQPRMVRAASGGVLSAMMDADPGGDDGDMELGALPHETREAQMQRVEAKLSSPTNFQEAAHLARRSQVMVCLMYIHFSLGFRCFYLAIPVALWRAGPLPLLISSLGIGAFLWLADAEVTLMP